MIETANIECRLSEEETANVFYNNKEPGNVEEHSRYQTKQMGSADGSFYW